MTAVDPTIPPADPLAVVEAPQPVPAQPDPPPAAETPPETFSRQYVEELRREAAGYRTKLSPYEELFDGLDDTTGEAFRNAIATFKANDQAGVAELIQALGGQVPEGPQYLTAEQAQQIADARLDEFRQEQAVQEVYRQAEALGYMPDSDETVLFLRALNNQPDGQMDYKAADAAVKAYKQSIIEGYIKTKGAQANVPIQPEGGATVPRDDNPPKTLAEAKDRAEARIRAAQAAR